MQLNRPQLWPARRQPQPLTIGRRDGLLAILLLWCVSLISRIKISSTQGHSIPTWTWSMIQYHYSMLPHKNPIHSLLGPTGLSSGMLRLGKYAAQVLCGQYGDLCRWAIAGASTSPTQPGARRTLCHRVGIWQKWGNPERSPAHQKVIRIFLSYTELRSHTSLPGMRNGCP